MPSLVAFGVNGFQKQGLKGFIEDAVVLLCWLARSRERVNV